MPRPRNDSDASRMMTRASSRVATISAGVSTLGRMCRSMIANPPPLRIVIPGIVNTFIGLFKDTTLVSIVGLLDLVRAIEASRVDPVWAAPTVSYTGYAFAGLFYWVCCFGMSRYSIMVERKLAAGQRR